MPEVLAGYIADGGASFFLPRLSQAGGKAFGMYLGVTGARVSGFDLFKHGIASHYIKKEHLEKLKQELRENIDNDTTIFEVQDIMASF